jgi:hypothetical protein
LMHAASSLHAYPNYLSYANQVWGGPTRAYKYQPWLDSGQGYLQAKDYLDRHPAESCWLFTDWYWDPAVYGVRCQPIGWNFQNRIPPSVQGTIIVSSTLLNTIREEQGQEMAPFLTKVPRDFIGGSALLVYDGDFDTSAAAGVSEWRSAFFGDERPDVALQYASNAVALLPRSPAAHEVRCRLLANSGDFSAAISECETALSLARGDRLHQEEMQLEAENIEDVIRKIRYAANFPSP